jgi:hypothetical protein
MGLRVSDAATARGGEIIRRVDDVDGPLLAMRRFG